MTTTRRTILTAALAAGTAAAYTPIQTDLQQALTAADRAWNEGAAVPLHADIAAIRFERLNDCRTTDTAAFSYFSARVIVVNSACRWTPALLREVVTHEYGHMLNGNAGHNNDPHSVMTAAVNKHGKVTADDRGAAAIYIGDRAHRPTILIGDK